MPLVDVHCHINHALLKDSIPEVLDRAQKNGVKIIVLSGVNPSANKEVLALAQKYPMIKASLGIYPIDALGLTPDEVGLPHHKGPIDLDEQFSFIENNLNQVISIGEIGMDFHWASKEETLEQQQKNFRKIIRFAIKVQKPIVIHSRKAEKECIDVLEEEIKNNEIPVIQHCFSGKKNLIKRAAALGHYFSVPANVIRSHSFQTMVKLVPISQLLTETDSPWLSPNREEVNEPKNVLLSIQKIAEIKDLSLEDTQKTVWNNFCQAFKFKDLN